MSKRVFRGVFPVIAILCSLVGDMLIGEGARAADEIRGSQALLDILDARVSYDADFMVTLGRHMIDGRVYHSPGKERREYQWRGENQILLLRRDLNLVYWLMPARRLCVAFSLEDVGKLSGDLNTLSVKRTDDGEERIDGMPLRRFLLNGKTASGITFSGKMWEYVDGVVVKVHGESDGGSKDMRRIEMGISNIIFQPQKESLFDVPGGYITLSMQNADLEQINRLFSGKK